MGKKKHEYGPLYQHAKVELELAGTLGGKGHMDQQVSNTVLKLVDVFERGGTTELLAATIMNTFQVLGRGELINAPTDHPDEWMLVPGMLGEDGKPLCVLRRCHEYKSRDGGVTWFRSDGANGVSKKVIIEETVDASEKEETV